MNFKEEFILKHIILNKTISIIIILILMLLTAKNNYYIGILNVFLIKYIIENDYEYTFEATKESEIKSNLTELERIKKINKIITNTSAILLFLSLLIERI